MQCEPAIGRSLSGAQLHIKIGKVVSFSLPTDQRILHYSTVVDIKEIIAGNDVVRGAKGVIILGNAAHFTIMCDL